MYIMLGSAWDVGSSGGTDAALHTGWDCEGRCESMEVSTSTPGYLDHDPIRGRRVKS